MEFIILIRTPNGDRLERVQALNQGEDLANQVNAMIASGQLPEGSYGLGSQKIESAATGWGGGRDATGAIVGSESEMWENISQNIQKLMQDNGSGGRVDTDGNSIGLSMNSAQSGLLASKLALNPTGASGGITPPTQENLDVAAPQAIFRNWLRERQGITSPGAPFAAGTGYTQGLAGIAPLLGAASQAFFGGELGEGEGEWTLNNPAEGFKSFLNRVGATMGVDTGRGVGGAFGDVAQGMLNTIGGLNMDLPPGVRTWASPGSPESQGAQQVDALTQAALRSRMGAMGAQMFGGNIVDESSRQFWDQYAQTGVQPESYARWMLRKSGSPDFVPS